MKWYSFKPADTLFFRSGQPMNIGIDHTATAVFPPTTQTIAGALRSAVLIQKGMSIEDYYSNNDTHQNIIAIIGKAGESPNFNVIGPLFKKGNKVYTPAPYSWFIKKNGKTGKRVKIYKLTSIETPLIVSPNRDVYWARGTTDKVESLGSMWILLDALQSEEVVCKSIQDFFVQEARTGIALQKNRRIRKHHIYSFTHARLRKDVDVIFGVDRDLPLRQRGILKLGAEQRFGIYQESEIPDFQSGDSGYFMSLSLVESTPSANSSLVATGKPEYIGGWDMRKRFHKAMKGYFPAGSVFNQKLDENFIEL